MGPESKLKEHAARNLGIEFCVEMKCDYYLSLDGEAHLDNPETVKLLIGQNRNVIAPMLVRPMKAWSNFWGALNNEGWCSGPSFIFVIWNILSGSKKIYTLLPHRVLSACSSTQGSISA